jgi:hypothetical protein
MVSGALGPLVGLSLIVNAAVDPVLPERAALTPGLNMTPQEQRATMQPLIRSANECIAKAVSAHPRYSSATEPVQVNDLIVDSIPNCIEPVRALINGHDQLYGDGTGERFFMGPYLDALPGAVQALMRTTTR